MEISSKDVGPCPLTANRCNANGGVTGLRTRNTTRSGGDAAESFLPVVVPTRAAAAEAIAAYGVLDAAALDVTTTKVSGCGDMRVGASCAKACHAPAPQLSVIASNQHSEPAAHTTRRLSTFMFHTLSGKDNLLR
jgi:hypothetical protein